MLVKPLLTFPETLLKCSGGGIAYGFGVCLPPLVQGADTSALRFRGVGDAYVDRYALRC